jgi:hypothetical protein
MKFRAVLEYQHPNGISGSILIRNSRRNWCAMNAAPMAAFKQFNCGQAVTAGRATGCSALRSKMGSRKQPLLSGSQRTAAFKAAPRLTASALRLACK